MTKRKPEELTKDELLYELLFKKYGTIDLSKVFYTGQMTDGSYSTKLGGKKLSDGELANLKNEAQMIAGTRLWSLMVETLKSTAHIHLFTQMKTLEDSHWGKAILYAISIEETVFKGIENAHVNKPSPSARTQYHPNLSTAPTDM